MKMTIRGTVLDDGGVCLEADFSDDAWMKVEYRDGWVGRKLIADDGDDYEDMVHPFYFRCRCCRRYLPTGRWGSESQFCPGCEQRWHQIGDWFEATSDGGELPKPTVCPECSSTSISLAAVTPSVCNDCGHEFIPEQENTA